MSDCMVILTNGRRCGRRVLYEGEIRCFAHGGRSATQDGERFELPKPCRCLDGPTLVGDPECIRCGRVPETVAL